MTNNSSAAARREPKILSQTTRDEKIYSQANGISINVIEKIIAEHASCRARNRESRHELAWVSTQNNFDATAGSW